MFVKHSVWLKALVCIPLIILCVILWGCEKNNSIGFSSAGDNIYGKADSVSVNDKSQSEEISGILERIDSSAVIDDGKCGDNLFWKFYEDGLLYIYGDGSMENYGTKKSDTPTPWSKYVGRLNAILLENGIKTIGTYAFYDCSDITGNLNIPESVEAIGDYAFWGCKGFTGSLIIPDSVIKIGSGAFANCTGFTGDLSIGNGVSVIEEDTFWGCSGFKGNLTIGNSVTWISEKAFVGCSGITGGLTIPSSVEYIGPSAFSGCRSFTGDLKIGGNVKKSEKMPLMNAMTSLRYIFTEIRPNSGGGIKMDLCRKRSYTILCQRNSRMGILYRL